MKIGDEEYNSGVLEINKDIIECLKKINEAIDFTIKKHDKRNRYLIRSRIVTYLFRQNFDMAMSFASEQIKKESRDDE